jgi:NAD(P)-dependent dehydrogenase (short-subunit alcohol dehydrogenase family)
MAIPSDHWDICLTVLQKIADDPSLIDDHDRCKSLIAKIYRKGRKGLRRLGLKIRHAADQKLKSATAIVKHQKRHSLPRLMSDDPAQALNLAAIRAMTADDLAYASSSDPVRSNEASLPPDLAQAVAHLHRPIPCYVCKQLFSRLHFFYHLLCPGCAEMNFKKRQQRTDLSGRSVLLTGGRVKIGYQLGLRLLRDGARVILTTRFPADCAARYGAESDFLQWYERLEIHALDLRNVPAVEAFAHQLLKTESSLDIVINNAAQTIKRPLAFYQHVLDSEQQTFNQLSPQARLLIRNDRFAAANARLARTELMEARFRGGEFDANQLPEVINAFFPPRHLDADGQQVDLRPTNSWLQKLGTVSTIEMLEVQLVNAIAPFIFSSKLKPLLMNSAFARRFIVNVSAMEGQFSREAKTSKHPHTNMAKAALNMMTRTASADYANDGIYMNSVDTGWITNENPAPVIAKIAAIQKAYTPLDAIDGMARVYDVIARGINEVQSPLSGCFLKDYAPYPW